MSYLTDNPMPLLLLLAAVAVVAFLSGSSTGRGVAGTCVLLGVGLFFLEQFLVSPAEEVETQLEQMLQHFKDRDVDAIAAQISAGSQELAELAKDGLNRVDVSESFHIKSVDVTIDDSGQNATAMVRANGSVILRQHGGATQHVPTFWKTAWKHEGGSWLLAEVTRLSPANGEEMEVFAAK